MLEPGANVGSRVISKDAFTLLCGVQHILSQPLEIEADPTHPLGHQRAIQFHPVVGVNLFLPTERGFLALAPLTLLIPAESRANQR